MNIVERAKVAVSCDCSINTFNIFEYAKEVLSEKRGLVFDRLLSELKEEKSPVFNPEIFLQLHALQQSERDSNAELCATILLSVHLNLQDIEKYNSIPLNYVRCFISNGNLYQKEKEEFNIIQVSKKQIDNIQIIPPINGLYNDFLDAKYYPALNQSIDFNNEAKKIRNACEIIEKYSETVFSDIKDTVSLIVIVPPLIKSVRYSYSCQLAYIGGIFIDTNEVDEIVIARRIIHEYLHTKLWLWWRSNKFLNLDINYGFVKSPFTFRNINSVTMLQAATIYTSIKHFNGYLKSPTDQIFVKNLNNLILILRTKFKSQTNALKLLDFLESIK